MYNLFTKTIKILLLVYIGFGLVLFIFQKNYLYYPSNQDFNSCSGFKNSDKLNLNGTRAYYKRSSDEIIIFYHGNAGSACDRAFLSFEDHSYIFVEYAGYSNDSRPPSKKLLMKDVENINDFIQKQNFKKVVIAGESLGASLALYHSSLTNEDKILLISPFYKISDVAKAHFPLYPTSLLLFDQYDNSKWIGDIKSIKIIHGKNDDIIPISQAEILFDKINVKDKELVIIENAGHNDLYDNSQTYSAIINFLR